jgi:hypothetical protein
VLIAYAQRDSARRNLPLQGHSRVREGLRARADAARGGTLTGDAASDTVAGAETAGVPPELGPILLRMFLQLGHSWVRSFIEQS